MFGALKALSSIRAKTTTQQIIAHRSRNRTLDSLQDFSSASLFSFLLLSGSNRLDLFGRLCSSNAKNSEQEKKPESPSEEKKIKASPEDSNLGNEQSTTVNNNTKRQIRELIDTLQGFSWNEKSTENRKSSKQTQELFPSMLQFLLGPSKWLQQTCNWLYGEVIAKYVDLDFDINEFLEGAKDAYYMVNQLFAEGDFENLRPMVSTKLFENFKAVSDDFKHKGMIMSISTEDIKGVNISGLKVASANSLTEYGPEFKIPPTTDGKENSWFLIYVRFSSYHRFKVMRPGGSVVSDSLSYRRDLWTFVRGPISNLPLKDPVPGWTLLTIA